MSLLAFDVQRRELPRLLPVCLAYGLVMASLYVLKPARNALFLDRLGVGQLPYVLMLVALVGGVTALAFSRAARRVDLDRLVFLTFLVLAACLLGFRLLLPLGLGWSYYLFYIWVNLYGLMATSLLWLLANALFNAREGRRLFGLIGTAGIVGAIVGGVFTGWVVARVGTENLLLVCAGALGLCLLLLHPVRVRDAPPPEPGGDTGGEGPLEAVRASRLLSLLAGMAGLAAAVAAIIDVQFNQIVDAAYPDKDAKTAFFGQFFAGLSAFALLFQVAVTPRVLRSAGVTAALLFLPVSMALGSAAVLLVPGLAAGALVKLGDGSFRHSIHKSATEILYLPVPAEAKKRTKVLLDTTVDNLATGLGALVVTLALGAGLGYHHLSYLSLALVVVWLVLVVRSRRAYVDTFRRALERRDIDLSEYTVDIGEAGTLDSLMSVLERTGHDRHLAYALDMLCGVRAQRLVAPVTALLEHGAPEVRQRALQVLQAQSGPLPLERVEARLQDDWLAVRVEALHTLCIHGEGERTERLRAALASTDSKLRGAAIGCIAEHGTEAEQGLVDEDLVRATLDDAAGDEAALQQAARLLGSIYDPSRPWTRQMVTQLAASPYPGVLRQLTESLGSVGDEEHLPWLLERLDDRRTRRVAAAALARYGDRAVTALAARVADESRPPRARNHAARALAGIATPACVEAVLNHLEGTPSALQYQLLKSLSKMRTRNPALTFPPDRVRPLLRSAARGYRELSQAVHLLQDDDGDTARVLLCKAIEEKRQQHLKRLFRLLALLYPPGDLYNAFLGYIGGEGEARGSALEFLENVLDREDRELVVPLLDAEGPEAVARAGTPLFGAPWATATIALEHLLAGSDGWLRACVAHRALRSGPEALRQHLRHLTDDPDPRVAEQARQALSEAG